MDNMEICRKALMEILTLMDIKMLDGIIQIYKTNNL
jgi:hypothetical protein